MVNIKGKMIDLCDVIAGGTLREDRARKGNVDFRSLTEGGQL